MMFAGLCGFIVLVGAGRIVTDRNAIILGGDNEEAKTASMYNMLLIIGILTLIVQIVGFVCYQQCDKEDNVGLEISKAGIVGASGFILAAGLSKLIWSQVECIPPPPDDV